MASRLPRGLLLAVLVGIGLRLAAIAAFPGMNLVSDEQDYVRAADALLRGEQDRWLLFHPPLYTAFCAAVRGLWGPSDDAVRVAQALLEGLTIVGLWLLAGRVFEARTATIAAWLYALHPEFITYSHYLWSECVTLAVLVWALLALLRFRERPGWTGAVAVGVLWALASLIKPYHLYLLPLLLLALLLGPGGVGTGGVGREQAGRARTAWLAALALGICVLLIVPWSVHVSREKGWPVVICTVAALSLATGTNTAPPPQFDFGSTSKSTGKSIRADPDKRTGGVVAFIAANPGLYLQRSLEKLSHLWSPNSYFLRCLYWSEKYGPPGEIPVALRLGAVGGVLVATALLTLGCIAGFWFSRAGPLHLLAAAYALPYMGMITLTPSFSRYRLPLMPFVVVFCAAWLAGQAPIAAGWRRPLARWGAIVCALGLILVWLARLPQVFEQVV